MKCRYCGTDNPPAATACQNCNRPLSAAVSEDDATIAQQTSEFSEPLFDIPAFSRRYKVLKLLGKGGMGVVYKAWDKELEEEVAIKILIPEFISDAQMLSRFKREIKLARSITHENVCKIYHLGENEGIRYITMELIEGESLEHILKAKGKLNTNEAIRIIDQITDSLATFHKKGIIHRDLKPVNIMINPEGKVYIMDFGIAKSIESEELTRTGDAVGTPAYMAPEQIEGRKVDNRADIYSLGVILYRMFTGHPVFEADTPYTMAIKQLKEQPRKPREVNPQIPEYIENIILKCLKKNPDERYNSALQIIEDFKKASVAEPETIALGETVPTEELETITEKPTGTAIKKIALILATVIVIAAGLIFLYLQIWREKEKATTPPPSADRGAKEALIAPEMILIPAGEFIMGSSDYAEEGNPLRRVHLKAFYIDKYEVTNAQYKEYVDATGATAPLNWTEGKFPAGRENYPIVGITWEEASNYAQWVGKRLPTEEEWEKAARGNDGRIYPWGNDFKPHWANISRDGPSAIGSFQEDKSPYGIFDMAGNVREWTSTQVKRKDKSGKLHDQIIIRGGSWGPQLPSENARCSNRGFMPINPSKQQFTVLGFRCAKDAE